MRPNAGRSDWKNANSSTCSNEQERFSRFANKEPPIPSGGSVRSGARTHFRAFRPAYGFFLLIRL